VYVHQTNMSAPTLTGSALREFVISEARRLQVQNSIQLSSYEEIRRNAAGTAKSLNGVLENLTTLRDEAMAAMSGADGWIESLQRDQEYIAGLLTRLEADIAAGRPSDLGTLVIEGGGK